MELSYKAYHVLLFYLGYFERREAQQRQWRGLSNLKHVIQLRIILHVPFADKF